MGKSNGSSTILFCMILTMSILLSQKILEVKKQYSALVYDFDNLHEICNEELQLTINHQLFLETLLMEIRGKTISFSSYKKKERERIEKN